MKYALVTGGSGTIGAAICRQLAAADNHVHIHANKNADQAHKLADELNAAGYSASVVVFDLTDASATRAALAGVLDQGPVQILVNNAGIYHDAPLAGMNDEQWHRVISVTVDGFYNATQPLLLPMIRTRWGRIVSITSVSGLIGNRGQVNYSAAKSALHGATKALALEVATRGITVNAVAPGVIAGPTTDAVFNEDAIKRLVPMQRAGKPEEVASLVAYLASDQAAYISGQIVSVNGAMA